MKIDLKLRLKNFFPIIITRIPNIFHMPKIMLHIYFRYSFIKIILDSNKKILINFLIFYDLYKMSCQFFLFICSHTFTNITNIRQNTNSSRILEKKHNQIWYKFRHKLHTIVEFCITHSFSHHLTSLYVLICAYPYPIPETKKSVR